MTKLCSLYAAWSLERRLSDLFAGGYAIPESKIDIFLRDGIISVSKDLVKDAVALVDTLAPPDFILNSPLGMSDGEVNNKKECLHNFISICYKFLPIRNFLLPIISVECFGLDLQTFGKSLYGKSGKS